VQLGFGERKHSRLTKPLAGHLQRAGLEVAPAVLRSIPLPEGVDATAGDVITVEIFEPGDRIKVTGTTKGRGFQGVVKRHGFRGGPAAHGSTRYRNPGSIGAGTDPSRVLKGKRLPGQMGAARQTQIGLSVAKIDVERNLLYVKGSIPGPLKGVVLVRKQGGKSRYA
jgi:large subunit ribosomal protein L3